MTDFSLQEQTKSNGGAEKRNLSFCLSHRFAERAQTDFGVQAVIKWAKEGNLGPEVQVERDMA